ncbi:MAG: cytochrome P460 family protein [Planctomycetota bacterium]
MKDAAAPIMTKERFHYTRRPVMKIRLLFLPVLLPGFFFLNEAGVAYGASKSAGIALWDYITKGDPYAEWQLWPGKKPFYKGTVPHGALLTLYVSPNSYDAIRHKKRNMPYGAVLVKENYMPDKMLGAITVMYKRAGYNPEAGDWFWAKYSKNGEVMAAGRAPMCIECHGMKKANDYIMTDREVK